MTVDVSSIRKCIQLNFEKKCFRLIAKGRDTYIILTLHFLTNYLAMYFKSIAMTSRIKRLEMRNNKRHLLLTKSVIPFFLLSYISVLWMTLTME